MMGSSTISKFLVALSCLINWQQHDSSEYDFKQNLESDFFVVNRVKPCSQWMLGSKSWLEILTAAGDPDLRFN